MKPQKFLSPLLATALISVSTSALANQVQVNGVANADNRFVVAVTDGNLPPTVVYTAPSNYSWGQTKRFSFSIDASKNLEKCRVNLINWGDGSVAEGASFVFKGNNGTVYSGSSGYQSSESSVNAGGFNSVPNTNTIANITPATGSPTSAGSTQSNPVWGTIKTNYTPADFNAGAVPNNFDWVRPAGSSQTTRNHFVHSIPCGNLVKPEAVHMEGEHFQCYKLEKGDRLKATPITIQDQFGKSEVVLGQPRMLCNPSSKVHNRKEFGILNKERHLVCYDYAKQSRVSPQDLKINNQFAPDDVVSTRREMFCVPSSKEHMRKDGYKNKLDRVKRRKSRVEPIQQRR